MKKVLLIFLTIFFFFSASLKISSAGLVKIGELLENPTKRNGEKVEIKGELIGAILKDGNRGFWLNINDGSAAIGVYLTKEVLENQKADEWKGGSYSIKGTEILVKGFFNASCTKHGGDLDVHAIEVKAISESQSINHSLSIWKVALALFLLFLAFLIPFFLRT